MEKSYYPQIFKRKSFHIFKNIGALSPTDLQNITAFWDTLTPLDPAIPTAMTIMPVDQAACKRGEEYCLYLYSAKTNGWLRNMGYLGEQLDLYLTSQNIGSLWYGIGKPEEKVYHGLNYVIMIAIAKMPEDTFRKDMYKSKRKSIEEIWTGPTGAIADVVRFAPSACNTQPWQVTVKEDKLQVFRVKPTIKHGIMPLVAAPYFNRIDMGIFLCFVELCLQNADIQFDRTLYPDDDNQDGSLILNAEYQLHSKL
jgi:hypothetical protein